MCGIAGYLSPTRIASPEIVLAEMAGTLMHRGPDDSGIWLDVSSGIGIAHSRLAVIDLSPTGHQPMVSVSGRYVFVFNGEIYNHLELRKELNASSVAQNWRGSSDTETILAAIETWGVTRTLEKSRGMFALALWDKSEKCLLLARDRLGEKPLYFGRQNGCFLFCSELKALKKHPAFAGEISRDALTLYLQHNYIPTPYSIYTDICKLDPGSMLKVNIDSMMTGQVFKPQKYWSFTETFDTGKRDRFSGGDDEAINRLELLLGESIETQMVADVPLGAFLSGGIDSSIVVALMQKRSEKPIKTFSIGFADHQFNEAGYAKEVSRIVGTDHTELYVTPRHALEVIPNLPNIFDEPFSDPSQIPTCILSQMTRQHVTVSLSGDGGDELFGGYDRYRWGQQINHVANLVPDKLLKPLATLMKTVSPSALNRIFLMISQVIPGKYQVNRLGDRVHRLSEILLAESPEMRYCKLVSHWDKAEDVVIGGKKPAALFDNISSGITSQNYTEFMMVLDSVTYLPDDILVKVDRAAMAASLETRIPFLDHKLVEFACSLPLHMKIRKGTSKWLLKQVLYRHIPKEMVDRPKMGFGLPMDAWLRGPLREWAEDLLSTSRLENDGFFRPEPIRQKWKEHLSGERNWQYHLWDILMFQAWKARQ